MRYKQKKKKLQPKNNNNNNLEPLSKLKKRRGLSLNPAFV